MLRRHGSTTVGNFNALFQLIARFRELRSLLALATWGDGSQGEVTLFLWVLQRIPGGQAKRFAVLGESRSKLQSTFSGKICESSRPLAETSNLFWGN